MTCCFVVWELKVNRVIVACFTTVSWFGAQCFGAGSLRAGSTVVLAMIFPVGCSHTTDENSYLRPCKMICMYVDRWCLFTFPAVEEYSSSRDSRKVNKILGMYGLQPWRQYT